MRRQTLFTSVVQILIKSICYRGGISLLNQSLCYAWARGKAVVAVLLDIFPGNVESSLNQFVHNHLGPFDTIIKVKAIVLPLSTNNLVKFFLERFKISISWEVPSDMNGADLIPLC